MTLCVRGYQLRCPSIQGTHDNILSCWETHEKASSSQWTDFTVYLSWFAKITRIQDSHKFNLKRWYQTWPTASRQLTGSQNWLHSICWQALDAPSTDNRFKIQKCLLSCLTTTHRTHGICIEMWNVVQSDRNLLNNILWEERNNATSNKNTCITFKNVWLSFENKLSNHISPALL